MLACVPAGWSTTNRVEVDTTAEYEFSVWVKNDDDDVRTYDNPLVHSRVYPLAPRLTNHIHIP